MLMRPLIIQCRFLFFQLISILYRNGVFFVINRFWSFFEHLIFIFFIMLNVPASLKCVLLIRWLNFVFHRCGVTDDLISESFMQDQKFLKYRSLILRCVAACLFLAEDMQPSMVRNHNQNHTVGLLNSVILILLWRCTYLFRNNTNVKYWVNIVELDALFRTYIQTAEFAKSKLFLHKQNIQYISWASLAT